MTWSSKLYKNQNTVAISQVTIPQGKIYLFNLQHHTLLELCSIVPTKINLIGSIIGLVVGNLD